VNPPVGGSLTDGELDQVGQLLAEGRLHHDPAVLSATDRVLDTISERVKRRQSSRPAQATQAPTPARTPAPSDQSEQVCRLPRTLDELLELRRGLLGHSGSSSDEP